MATGDGSTTLKVNWELSIIIFFIVTTSPAALHFPASPFVLHAWRPWCLHSCHLKANRLSLTSAPSTFLQFQCSPFKLSRIIVNSFQTYSAPPTTFVLCFSIKENVLMISYHPSPWLTAINGDVLTFQSAPTLPRLTPFVSSSPRIFLTPSFLPHWKHH